MGHHMTCRGSCHKRLTECFLSRQSLDVDTDYTCFCIQLGKEPAILLILQARHPVRVCCDLPGSAMTSRACQIGVVLLATLSLASAAHPGRHLLSDDDAQSGLLVTYWGQNSAAPTYQEPELDEVLGRSCFTLPVLFI